MRRIRGLEENGSTYISYADVYEWQRDCDRSYNVITAWGVILRMDRAKGTLIQEVVHVARRRDSKGSLQHVKSTYKRFGRDTDHATLPGAMLAALIEFGNYIEELEGKKDDDDPDSAALLAF